MKIPIALSTEGIDILLTDEHPTCLRHVVPCVTVGNGPRVKAFGKANRIWTANGLYEAAQLVIEWLDREKETSREARALAIQFLSRPPDYL